MAGNNEQDKNKSLSGLFDPAILNLQYRDDVRIETVDNDKTGLTTLVIHANFGKEFGVDEVQDAPVLPMVHPFSDDFKL